MPSLLTNLDPTAYCLLTSRLSSPSFQMQTKVYEELLFRIVLFVIAAAAKKHLSEANGCLRKQCEALIEISWCLCNAFIPISSLAMNLNSKLATNCNSLAHLNLAFMLLFLKLGFLTLVRSQKIVPTQFSKDSLPYFLFQILSGLRPDLEQCVCVCKASNGHHQSPWMFRY